jgi:hypothetical protein
VAENYWLKGLVRSLPFMANGEQTASISPHGALLADQMRGTYGELARQSKVFTGTVAAVTIPVVANNMVSVCGIYNPPGSNVDLEVLDVDIMNVLATTVVDAFGVYYSTAALSALATFTTLAPANVQCGRLGDAAPGAARFYSAVTHSGTPVLARIIGGHGATTTTGSSLRKDLNGSLIIPPGILASIAASTAAGTASGNTIALTWAELPIR